MKYCILKTNILKKSDKSKGGAIIAVLCIMAILFALTASLLLATNVIVNNNSLYKDEIQCKLAANSFAGALQDKLADSTDPFTKKISELLTNGWIYYNDSIVHHGHSYADKKFTIKDEESDLVHSIVMYYEADEETAEQPWNYVLVIELTTKYKNDDDIVYKVVSRFNRTNEEPGYHWYLSGNDKGEN